MSCPRSTATPALCVSVCVCGGVDEALVGVTFFITLKVDTTYLLSHYTSSSVSLSKSHAQVSGAGVINSI